MTGSKNIVWPLLTYMRVIKITLLIAERVATGRTYLNEYKIPLDIPQRIVYKVRPSLSRGGAVR